MSTRRLVERICSGIALVVAVSCAAQSVPEPKDLEFVFPSLKPFLAAQIREELWSDRELSLEESREHIEEALMIVDALVPPRGAAHADRKSSVEAAATGIDARLYPRVPREDSTWLSILPAYVSVGAALWERQTWTERDVELANLVAEFLTRNELGMEVEFALGEDERNRESLERVGHWFKGLASEAHYFALMCTSFLAYGPSQGLPIELSEARTDSAISDSVLASVSLNDDITLRLIRLPELEEPFVLQAVIADELCWSRQVSNAPGAPFESVELIEAQLVQHGEYGWEIGAEFEFGGELREGRFYVDRFGELRFYAYFSELGFWGGPSEHDSGAHQGRFAREAQVGG